MLPNWFEMLVQVSVSIGLIHVAPSLYDVDGSLARPLFCEDLLSSFITIAIRFHGIVMIEHFVEECLIISRIARIIKMSHSVIVVFVVAAHSS